MRGQTRRDSATRRTAPRLRPGTRLRSARRSPGAAGIQARGLSRQPMHPVQRGPRQRVLAQIRQIGDAHGLDEPNHLIRRIQHQGLRHQAVEYPPVGVVLQLRAREASSGAGKAASSCLPTVSARATSSGDAALIARMAASPSSMWRRAASGPPPVPEKKSGDIREHGMEARLQGICRAGNARPAR
ncbi:hypothetical protein Ddc_24502 [Ditylenchus destructor]|nr:hypothetical protein Ddc_24502 [Ditylenchus destructor]